MLHEILSRIGDFLGGVKLYIAILALVGLFFSGTLFYICAVLLIVEVLLPYAETLIVDVTKFAIKK